ncbi:MAG: tyrosine-type recombinase/integrase [Pseudomonadota bacterium]|nr:tyrosine-type recombinase/integrase [Pseudomonadota bacterium]
MNTPLLLPYYYQKQIEHFWKGLLPEALTDDIDTKTIQSTYTLLKQKTRNKKQYSLVHFLLGLNELSDYSAQYSERFESNQSTLPKLLGKLGLKLENLIDAITILNTLIDYGNVKGFWKLNLILKVEKIPLIKNPMGLDDDWQKMLYCNQLVEHILSSEEPELESMTTSEQLGLIVFSLIFDSQIIRHQSLLTILGKIQNEDNFNYLDGNLFFLVPPDDYNPPKKIFIAKKTEILIYQTGMYLDIPENTSEQEILKYITLAIQDYLKSLNIAYSALPKTLFKWCRWAYVFHHQNTPPLMVNYQSGLNQAHSLNPSASERVYGIEQYDLGEFKSAKTLNTPKIRNSSYALKIIQQIFDIKVKNKDAFNIKQSIEDSAAKIMHQLPNNHQLILNWGLSLLEVNKTKKFKVGPSQILNKIYSIARHLIGIANQNAIQSLIPSERMSLFDSVIEQAVSSRNRETILYNLKAFNTWLEKTYTLNAIPNKEDYFGHPKVTDMTVNANLIHFDEYEEIKNTILNLCEKNPFKPIFKMMLMALILGFRCGLRSKEVFQLKLDDFIFCNTSPQIAIRESENRELKTTNAKRFLKLEDHMPIDEVVFLQNWYIKKCSETNHINTSHLQLEETQKQYYFFALSNQNDKHINFEKVKAPLMNIIRQVGQDDSLNFHHLRHSFASWHFLSACIAEFNLDTFSLFSHLPKTKDWLMQAELRKQQQLPTHLKSKKYPFWISKKMGHASFNTSFEHYVHTTDIVTLSLLQQASERYTTQQIAYFANLSISTLKKQKKALEYALNRHVKQYKKLNKARLDSLVPKEVWQAPKINLDEFTNPMEEFSMYNMMEIFHLASENNLTEENALHLGFSKQRTAEVIELFQSNPKYRLRRPYSQELIELHRLTEELKKLYQIDFNCLNSHVEFLSLLNTFSNRFFPYKRDLDSLKIQPNYHLVFNDMTSGNILMKVIKKLNLPFRIILRHTKKWDKKECKSGRNYWRTQLGLTPKFRMEMKQDSKKAIGPNGRIEIVINNTATHRNHAFYYLFVMLSAWTELNNEIR